MKVLASCLLMAFTLSACDVEEMIRRNDDRYLKPGALDVPLTNVYDTYQYKFLDKYRISHTWPTSAATCKYGHLPTVGVNRGLRGELFYVPDIYEKNGKTWQTSSTPEKPFDFDPYVRRYKVVSNIYDPASLGLDDDGRYDPNRLKKIGERVAEYEPQPVCDQTWVVTNHALMLYFRYRTVDDWKQYLSESNPTGQWSTIRVNDNDWTVQMVALAPSNYSTGPYQYWVLPIKDSGYTMVLRLGATPTSLQYPEAHARFEAAFRHLIESVKVENLNAQLEAEQAELGKKAREVLRKECQAMAKRTRPVQACKDLLAQPAD